MQIMCVFLYEKKDFEHKRRKKSVKINQLQRSINVFYISRIDEKSY